MNLSSQTTSATKEQVIQTVLSVLREQWSQIGVAIHSEEQVDYVIDPEALLLFSSEYARYDARLFEQIMDWLHKNGKAINIQRLTNIRKSFSLGNGEVIRAIADTLAKSSKKHNKWEVLAKKKLFTGTCGKLATDASTREHLFYSHSNISEPDAEKLDESFSEYGLITTPMEHRGMSQPPKVTSSSNIVFQLRSLFGCNSRADVLAWLLTHESGHPAQIADEVHFFNKSIQEILNQMSESGLVSYHRKERKKLFSLQQQHWNQFLGGEPVRWHNWATRFATVSVFTEAIIHVSKMKTSDVFKSAMLQAASKKYPFTEAFVQFDNIVPEQYLEKVSASIANVLKP